MRLYQKLKHADPVGRSMILCILLVLVVFVAAIAMSEPLPSLASDLSAATLIPTPLPIRLSVTTVSHWTETAEATPTRTPIPPELLENADATEWHYCRHGGVGDHRAGWDGCRNQSAPQTAFRRIKSLYRSQGDDAHRGGDAFHPPHGRNLHEFASPH